MSDDTSRTNGREDDEHCVPGSMGHESTYHQTPIISGIESLLSEATSQDDEHSVLAQIAAAHGMSLGELIATLVEMNHLFHVVAAPILPPISLLIITDEPPHRTPGRADTGLYGPFDGHDELPYDDVYGAANTFGQTIMPLVPLGMNFLTEPSTDDLTAIPLPTHRVEDESWAHGQQIGSAEDDTTGDGMLFDQFDLLGHLLRSMRQFYQIPATPEPRRPFDPLRGLARIRRERRLQEMRGGKSYQDRPAIDRRSLNTGSPEDDPDVDGYLDNMFRIHMLLSTILNVDMTPPVDLTPKEIAEAEHRANIVRAFVAGTKRARDMFVPYVEEVVPDATSAQLRLVHNEEPTATRENLDDTPDGAA